MDRVEINDREIAQWRLASQRLVGPKGTDEVDVVGGLLGVQAENHGQASWAIASRTDRLTAATLAERFDAGTILRTHVLRETWHYVLPADISWLVGLTGPRIRRLFRPHQRALDLGDDTLERATGHIVDSLGDGVHLTRAHVGERLSSEGLPGDGQALMVVLAHAELVGAICSGPMIDGQHTYARIEDRAPLARHLERGEALAELALRYFTGHGPATERDLSYWATLTLGDVRTGLSMVADQLDSFVYDGRTYWFGQPSPTTSRTPSVHLLQILDEYYRGYQYSRDVLDVAGLAPRGRESSAGMLIVDGQYAGDMRRSVTSDRVTFHVGVRRPLDADEIIGLEAEARRYGDHLALEAIVHADFETERTL